MFLIFLEERITMTRSVGLYARGPNRNKFGPQIDKERPQGPTLQLFLKKLNCYVPPLEVRGG